MLQIIDIEDNEIFTQISAKESATFLGGITGLEGITGVNLANIQDGIGNFSSKTSLFSMDNNKLFTIDLSRLTINLVMIFPSQLPQTLTFSNGT